MIVLHFKVRCQPEKSEAPPEIATYDATASEPAIA